MAVDTKLILRPGDKLTFVVTATDPLGEALEYKCAQNVSPEANWQESNIIEIVIEDKHIAKKKVFFVCIRSKRNYHANESFDDMALFSYTILPVK